MICFRLIFLSKEVIIHYAKHKYVWKTLSGGEFGWGGTSVKE